MISDEKQGSSDRLLDAEEKGEGMEVDVQEDGQKLQQREEKKDRKGTALRVETGLRVPFVCRWMNDPRVFHRYGQNQRQQQYAGLFGLDIANEQEQLYQKDVLGHTGCVNSIEFNPAEDILASGGDDMRVLLWRVTDLMCDKQPKPLQTMQQKHNSNIFAHQFSTDGREVYSGGNDGIFLAHDIETNIVLDRIDFDGSGDKNGYAVYNISANKALINYCLLVAFISQFYSGQYNPAYTSLFAIAAGPNGLLIYDLRNPKKPLMDSKFFSGLADQQTIYAGWNPTGTGLAALISHKEPVYIDLVESRAVRLCDETYSNQHTIKSLEFINDRQIITGSDHFQLFLWDIPEGDGKQKTEGIFSMQTVRSASSILKGHRSIANHVRYSDRNKLLVSCGVEKLIKKENELFECWHSIEMFGSYLKPRLRRLMENDERTSGRTRGRREDSVEEDLGMLLYFDELVMESNNLYGMPEVIDMTSDDDELNEHRIFFMQPGMYSSSSSEDDDEMEGDGESGDMDSEESSSEDDGEEGSSANRGNRDEEEDAVIAEIRKRRRALKDRLRALMAEGSNGSSSSSDVPSTGSSDSREDEEARSSSDEREPISSYPINSDQP
ncbi:hypothetical protein WR25_05356 [Diploscapter pachys]|uniref:Uncharacterized protein n=1 Tax=Diploscapter pachys TaxID=2018661 RepID=A0A2A2KA89_9BILA|nr:hypothetical protein WR25_05356 [Diploscapter pachys]